MYEIAKTVSFWIIFSIGIFYGLNMLYYVLDRLISDTFRYFGIYKSMIQFIIDKDRKKKKEVG